MALLDHLDETWQELLSEEFDEDYWSELEAFLDAERAEHEGEIYPPREQVFHALNAVPPDEIRVVLLGQDPYHGPGQAHGLAFSVLPGVKTPPSLRNIYKELAEDLGCEIPNHGYLTAWAEQGILLLNTALTVRHKEANSHRGQGWEEFTDAVIEKISDQDRPVVFILWGSKAKKKRELIDTDRHAVVEGYHPSPLSARYGFFGSKPFSKVNAHLTQMGHEPIDWQLPVDLS